MDFAIIGTGDKWLYRVKIVMKAATIFLNKIVNHPNFKNVYSISINEAWSLDSVSRSIGNIDDPTIFPDFPTDFPSFDLLPEERKIYEDLLDKIEHLNEHSSILHVNPETAEEIAFKEKMDSSKDIIALALEKQIAIFYREFLCVVDPVSKKDYATLLAEKICPNLDISDPNFPTLKINVEKAYIKLFIQKINQDKNKSLTFIPGNNISAQDFEESQRRNTEVAINKDINKFIQSKFVTDEYLTTLRKRTEAESILYAIQSDLSIKQIDINDVIQKFSRIDGIPTHETKLSELHNLLYVELNSGKFFIQEIIDLFLKKDDNKSLYEFYNEYEEAFRKELFDALAKTHNIDKNLTANFLIQIKETHASYARKDYFSIFYPLNNFIQATSDIFSQSPSKEDMLFAKTSQLIRDDEDEEEDADPKITRPNKMTERTEEACTQAFACKRFLSKAEINELGTRITPSVEEVEILSTTVKGQSWLDILSNFLSLIFSRKTPEVVISPLNTKNSIESKPSVLTTAWIPLKRSVDSLNKNRSAPELTPLSKAARL